MPGTTSAVEEAHAAPADKLKVSILGNNDIRRFCEVTGFHLATKIWGGSAINEWAY